MAGKRKARMAKGELVFGEHAAGPLARWMGRRGWKPAEAIRVLREIGVRLTDNSITWEVRERREGRPPARVGREDAAKLEALRRKTEPAPATKAG